MNNDFLKCPPTAEALSGGIIGPHPKHFLVSVGLVRYYYMSVSD
jgi:hypothetical protein